MSTVTEVLAVCDVEHSSDRLLSLVYDELRRLARWRLSQEPERQTLQATALVHEAYLRLVKSPSQSSWNSKEHFFGAATEAMRRILVESARRKKRVKHGGERMRVEPSDAILAVAGDHEEILAVDDLLDEFASKHPQQATLVKLRYFGGYSVQEAADLLGISPATAKRHWQFAKAWLYARLAESAD